MRDYCGISSAYEGKSKDTTGLGPQSGEVRKPIGIALRVSVGGVLIILLLLSYLIRN
jgi:hypothetical protein